MEHIFTNQHHGKPSFGGLVIMAAILIIKFLSNSDTTTILTNVSLIVMTLYYGVQITLMIGKRIREYRERHKK